MIEHSVCELPCMFTMFLINGVWAISCIVISYGAYKKGLKEATK